jgi:hypothetical protein
MFMLYIYVSARALCVYILIACSSRKLCGIAQMDVGYIIVCSVERRRELSGVVWPDLGGLGCYN